MSQPTDRIELPNMRPSGDQPLRKRRKANRGLGIGLGIGDDTDGPLEGNNIQSHIQNQTQTQDDDEWVDHDTASLATIDSERLHSSRPNRWRGSARQWAHLTEVDRGVVSALHRTRDGDLAAHLYNAFQLKKNIASAENHNGTVWKPKPYWTAWPLRARFNPGVFTRSTPYRQKHHSQRTASLSVHSIQRHDCSQAGGGNLFSGPSGPLAEMVTAVILRVAREQFQQRQHALLETEKGPLRAAVSADDERSELILQPTVRHLLAQLDKVLLFLHHTRAATPVFKESWYILQMQKRHMYRQSTLQGGSASGPSIMQRLPQPSKVQTRGWPSDEEEEGEDNADEQHEEDNVEGVDDDDGDDNGNEDGEGHNAITTQAPAKKVTAIKPPFVPFSGPGGVLVLRPPASTPTPAPIYVAPTPTHTPTPAPMPTPTPAPRMVASQPPMPAASSTYSRTSTPSTISTQADGSPFRTAGRPRIDTGRLPGETEAQYLVRRAREGHRRIPDVTYIPPPHIPAASKGRDASKSRDASNGRDASAAMWETVLQKHDHLKAKVEARKAVPLVKAVGRDERDKRKAERTEEAEKTAKAERKTERAEGRAEKAAKVERKAEKARNKAAAKADTNTPGNITMSRWALRDWTDVVGAAALSGAFDDEVIARTAQRCANLFGQGMALNTMEMPVRARGDASFSTATYKPGEPLALPTPNSRKTSAKDQVQRAWRQRRQRLARRDAIMAEDDDEETDAEDDKQKDNKEEDVEEDVDKEATGPDDAKSEAKLATPTSRLTQTPRLASTPSRLSRQSRQRSIVRGTPKKRVSAVFYCPRAGCDRAIEGFARRTNVVRHLKLVHGLTASTADIKPSRQSSQGLGRAGEWDI